MMKVWGWKRGGSVARLVLITVCCRISGRGVEGGLWVLTSGLGGLAIIGLGTGGGLVGRDSLGGRFGGAAGYMGQGGGGVLSFEFLSPVFEFAV
jgi:hypothetical protein